MANEQTALSDYVFWRGATQLNAGILSHEVNSRIFLDASPSKDLRIEIANELGFAALNLINVDQISIDIPGVSEPIGLLMSDAKINSDGENVLTFGVKRSPIWTTKSQKLRSGRTMLINFAHYRLRASQLPGFDLNGAGWRVRVIPISDETLAAPTAMHSDEYRVTHQLEFAREDGASFTPLEAQDFLENLHYFLSFCRGRWVATSFSVAIDEDGEVGMEQWGTGKVSPWRDPSSWIDKHHGGPILELFQPFCEKLADATWRDALSHVVYWFQRAKTDSAGSDGGCILLQASLERFAWHLLVHEKKSFSEKKFNKLSAASRLRIMLGALAIPTAIPPGLQELGAYAKARNLDGPEVFTLIRNRLVHPPKPTTVQDKVPYYEAYCLAKWYLELAVLSVCDYKGDYSNRTRSSRWVGQVEKVPWM
jgi:hypothetical protein